MKFMDPKKSLNEKMDVIFRMLDANGDGDVSHMEALGLTSICWVRVIRVRVRPRFGLHSMLRSILGLVFTWYG